MWYINDTRGILTASKIKLAKMNLSAFNIIYNMTSRETAEAMEEAKASHFNFGTMAHKLFEKFTNRNVTLQEIVDEFLQEYNITNRYLKDELKTLIIEQKKASWEITNEVDEQAYYKILSKADMTLDKLREQYYWADKFADILQKPQITRAEAKKLIVWESWNPNIADSVLKVALTNKDWDMGGMYTTEQRISATYKWKELWAKPDRIVFRSNKNPDVRYTLEQMNSMMEWLNRDQRKHMVDTEDLRCTIRDFKTEWQPIELYNNIMRFGDSKYGYIFSMAFYYLIVRIKYAIKSEVILDVIESSDPFFSYSMTVPVEIMNDKISEITRTMDAIIQAEESWERGQLTVQDIFDYPDLKKFYPILAWHIQSSQVVLDLSM